MICECDDLLEDDWPNDEEANDIMLAYAATEYEPGPRSGCASGILLLCLIVITVVLLLFR